MKNMEKRSDQQGKTKDAINKFSKQSCVQVVPIDFTGSFNRRAETFRNRRLWVVVYVVKTSILQLNKNYGECQKQFAIRYYETLFIHSFRSEFIRGEVGIWFGTPIRLIDSRSQFSVELIAVIFFGDRTLLDVTNQQIPLSTHSQLP